jgi:heme/copper-type cytochrome/quinol oxidase subunit 3
MRTEYSTIIQGQLVTPITSVTALPVIGYRLTAPLWWGNLLAIVIEGMVFVLTIASYFYLRLTFRDWPPPRIAYPDLGVGLLNLSILLASAVPMYLLQRATEKDHEKQARLAVALGLLMMLVSIVVRIYEFHGLNCQWDTNAYGSIVWLILSLHTVHLLAGTVETVWLTAWAFTHKLDKKHRLDLEVLAAYWYFVVGSWVVLFTVLYLTPRWI